MGEDRDRLGCKIVALLLRQDMAATEVLPLDDYSTFSPRCQYVEPPARLAIGTRAHARASAAHPRSSPLPVQATGPQGYDSVAPNWLAVFSAAEVNNRVREAIAAAIGRLQRRPEFVEAAKKANGLPVSPASISRPGNAGELNALLLAVALQEAK